MLDDYLYKALETLELTWDSLITLFLFQKNNLDCSIIAPAVQAYITELTKYRNDELHSTRKTFRQRFVEDTGSQGENGQSERPRVLCFNSHIFVTRGAYTPRESFQTIKHNVLDSVLGNLYTSFPQGSKNIASAFEILSMRPLSLAPTNEVSLSGDEELDVLLTQFAKEEAGTGSPALVTEQAARPESSVLKPLVLKQKYPQDKMEDLWKIIKHYHVDMIPNLLKLASITRLSSYF